MPLIMPNIDTRVGRNTKALITSVAERRDRHPDTMDLLITSALNSHPQSSFPDYISTNDGQITSLAMIQ